MNLENTTFDATDSASENAARPPTNSNVRNKLSIAIAYTHTASDSGVSVDALAFCSIVARHSDEVRKMLKRFLKCDAVEGTSPVEETLRTLVVEANRLVHRKRQETGSNRGTTITALLIVGSKAAVANVGDSRTYLLRNGQLRQLTQDHSLVFSLFKSGQITEDEIYSHPQKNEIYRSLGEREDVKIDTQTLDIGAGDRLLLCSDGLWEMVRNDQIAAILGSAATPQAACDRLVATAFDNGGEDNIGALAVYLE